MVNVYLSGSDARNAAADLWQQDQLKQLNDQFAPPPAPEPAQPIPSAPVEAAGVQGSSLPSPPAVGPAMTQPAPPAAVPPPQPSVAPNPTPDRNQIADQWQRSAIADAWEQNAISDVTKGVSQAGQGVQSALADVPKEAQGLVSNYSALPGATAPPPAQAAPTAPTGIPRPPVSAGQVATVSGPQDTNVQVDNSSPEAFIRSIAPAAQAAAARLGVPAEALIGMAANETGYGKFAAGNNLFGIKGSGPAGSTNAGTWEDYGNGPVQIRDNFRAYNNAQESFNDFADLIAGSDRYKNALGQSSVEGFVQALKNGGYMTDPNYVGKISSIVKNFGSTIQDAMAGAGQRVASAFGGGTDQTAASVGGPTRLDRTSQFQLGLSDADAYAACGPAAAIAFARAFGRNPTAQEALQLAKQSGWTQGGGMNGVVNEKKLMDAMGVPTTLETTVNWSKITSDVQNGNPVIVSTPGHYFTVDDAKQAQDGSTLYHVGTSGTDLRGGSEWMSAGEIQRRMGTANGALFADHPQASGPSITEQAAGVVRSVAAPVQQKAQDLLSAVSNLAQPVQQTAQGIIGTVGNIGGALGTTASNIGSALTSPSPTVPEGGGYGAVRPGGINPLANVPGPSAPAGSPIIAPEGGGYGVAGLAPVGQTGPLGQAAVGAGQLVQQVQSPGTGNPLIDIPGVAASALGTTAHAIQNGLEAVSPSSGSAVTVAGSDQLAQEFAARGGLQLQSQLQDLQSRRLGGEQGLEPRIQQIGGQLNQINQQITSGQPYAQAVEEAAQRNPNLPALQTTAGVGTAGLATPLAAEGAPLIARAIAEVLQPGTNPVELAHQAFSLLGHADSAGPATQDAIRAAWEAFGQRWSDNAAQREADLARIGDPRGFLQRVYDNLRQAASPTAGMVAPASPTAGPSGSGPAQADALGALGNAATSVTSTVQDVLRAREPAQAAVPFATTLGGAAAGGSGAYLGTDPNDPNRWEKIAGGALTGGALGYGAGVAATGGLGSADLWDTIRATRVGSLAGGIPTMTHIALNVPLQVGWKLLTDTPAAVISGHPETIPMEFVGAWQGLRTWAMNASQTLTQPGPLATGMGGGAGARALESGLLGLVKTHPVLQDMARELGSNMELWRAAAQQATQAGYTRLSPQWQAAVQHLVANPTPAMQAAAERAGDTFALRGPMGLQGEKMAQWLQGNRPGQFILPFFNIGYHVASQGIERSPLGLAGTAFDVARAPLGSGPYAAGAANRAVPPLAERLRNNLVGTGLAAEAYSQAAQGNITGNGPDDPAQRAELMSQGWMPNSTLVGGRWVDNHVLGPLGWSLSEAANLAEARGDTPYTRGTKEAAQRDGMQQFGNYVGRMGQYLEDETFLRSFGQILQAVGSSKDAGRLGEQEVASVAGSLVPQGALISNVASAVDPLARRPQPGDLGQALEARFPGLREQVPARTNAVGEPEQNPQYGAGILLPRSGTGQPSPVLTLLAGAGITLPTNPPKDINYSGRQITLSPDEQQLRQQMLGQRLTQTTQGYVNSSKFQALQPDQQKRALEPLVRAAEQYADQRVVAAMTPQDRRARLATAPRTGASAPVYPAAGSGLAGVIARQSAADADAAHQRLLAQYAGQQQPQLAGAGP